MDYRQRLQILVEHANQRDGFKPGTDAHAIDLSPEKRAAWQKILGSIISAEAAEENVMKPLFKAFASDSLIENYVRGHSEDEATHAGWIRNYLKSSFQFERKKA